MPSLRTSPPALPSLHSAPLPQPLLVADCHLILCGSCCRKEVRQRARDVSGWPRAQHDRGPERNPRPQVRPPRRCGFAPFARSPASAAATSGSPSSPARRAALRPQRFHPLASCEPPTPGLPLCGVSLGLAAKGSADDLVRRFSNLGQKSAAEVAKLNDFAIAERTDFNDAS